MTDEPVEDFITTEWSADDLESAYLKALESFDAAEASTQESLGESPAMSDSLETDAGEALPAPVPMLKPPPEKKSATSHEPPLVTPRQIVEACLFVGGMPLTAKRMAGLLKGNATSESIEQLIEDLNRQYLSENRPYEIRLNEGGYVLHLREEYERLRLKVYGVGPKEVKLTQDALEVLAVVAYHQPIGEPMMAELGKPNSGAILRQLLRRELLSVERSPENKKLVLYRTTARFLSLFGLRNLHELPRPELLNFK